MTFAKLFWSGRSQSVRLPKAFRFEGDKVLISKEGQRVILEPVSDGWAWLADMPGTLDDDFVRAVEESEGSYEERPDIDEFFK